MKNIAIFISGEGEAAQRITTLFNDGNRIKVEVIIADDSAAGILPSFEGENVTAVQISDSALESMATDIASLLKEKEVELIVLDGFTHQLPPAILETVQDKVITVSSVEEAPREVVAALEYRNLVQETPPEIKEQPEGPKSPEEEWAEVLKINFEPPKINDNPPPIPGEGEQEPPVIPQENDFNPQYQQVSYGGDNTRFSNSFYKRDNRDSRGSDGQPEPMPSTYLVWSVIMTVLCCFIPGIVAIVYSSMVSSRYYAGDYEGARKASRNAEIWIIVSFVLGVLSATLYVPIAMFN